MKTLKFFTILTLIGIVFIYGCFAFISWKSNPADWEESTRAMLVFISIGWVTIASIVVAAYNDIKK